MTSVEAPVESVFLLEGSEIQKGSPTREQAFPSRDSLRTQMPNGANNEQNLLRLGAGSVLRAW
jgi:hypothetical protein